jgi:hypothetical protein
MMPAARLRTWSAQRLLIPLLVGALSTLLVVCTLVGGSPEEILGALPAILLVLLLACGRYPGEDVLHRLAAAWRRPRPKAPAAIFPPPRPRSAPISDRLARLAASRPLRGPPPLAPPITR